jgi:CBS domain containing-hemolysin-like protein
MYNPALLGCFANKQTRDTSFIMHKTKMKQASSLGLPAGRSWLRAKFKFDHIGLVFIAAALCMTPAHASLFKGEALDTAADVITWVVLIIAPVIAIGVFLLVHILPEKIAEKRKHPQAKAIQTLCMLSLFFGGMLWPLAWLWAYSKPVLYKMAYGTDTVEPEHHKKTEPAAGMAEEDELKRLRAQVAELETRLAGKHPAERKKD